VDGTPVPPHHDEGALDLVRGCPFFQRRTERGWRADLGARRDWTRNRQRDQS